MLEKAAGELKFSQTQKADFMKNMENSREMQALTSLRYNGAVTPEAARALLEGDRARAYFEIVYGTNRENSAGIANRRMREAKDILGDGSKLTAAERAALKALMQNPETRAKIDAYEKRFPDAFKDGGSLRALRPKDGKQGDGAPKPGGDGPAPGREGDGGKPEGGDAAGPAPRFMREEDAAKYKPEHKPATEETANLKPELRPVWPGDPTHVPQKRSLTPEARKLLDFATARPEGNDAILLKQPGRATETEMMSLIRDPGYWADHALPAFVRKWHETFYGTGPVPRDMSGRQIDAPPLRPILLLPTPPTAAGGGKLEEAIRDIGTLVVRSAGAGAMAPGIKRLQGALNTMADGRGDKGAGLKTDGVFGPRTRARLRRMVAGQGASAVRGTFLSGSP